MSAFVGALVIMSLFSGAETDRIVVSADIMEEAAYIVAGESPVSLMGERAARGVAWTIRNRLEAGHSWNSVRSAYYARRVPTDRERTIVASVFYADRESDFTKRAMWVLSRQDVYKLGLRKADLTIVSKVNPIYSLNFYSRSPF